jgi:uncharacterized protein (TIGR02996 family)
MLVMPLVKMSRADGDAFEAHLSDNPHDKTGHLVYADWLDENDKPEAAATHRAFALNKKSPFSLTTSVHRPESVGLNEPDGSRLIDHVHHSWDTSDDGVVTLTSKSHDPKALYDFYVKHRRAVQPHALEAKIDSGHVLATTLAFPSSISHKIDDDKDWHRTPEGRNFFKHFALVQEADQAMEQAASSAVERSGVDPAIVDPQDESWYIDNPEFKRRTDEMVARMQERYRPFIEHTHPLNDPSSFRTLADLLRDNEAYDPEFMRHILDRE